MAEPQLISEIDNALTKIAVEKYGLKVIEEFQLKLGRAFVNGCAVLARQIDISDLGSDFFRRANQVSLILVLPVTEDFSRESDLIRSAAAVGGSVIRPPQGVTFAQFVSEYSEEHKHIPPEQIESKIPAVGIERLKAKALLEPYYYLQGEREELRRFYRESDDSSSIAS